MLRSTLRKDNGCIASELAASLGGPPAMFAMAGGNLLSVSVISGPNPARRAAVQPEAIAAGFITADHRCLHRQPEAPFGPGDFLEQTAEVARHQGPKPRRLSVPNGEYEFPLTPTQLQSQVQTNDGRARLSFADQRRHYLRGRLHLPQRTSRRSGLAGDRIFCCDDRAAPGWSRPIQHGFSACSATENSVGPCRPRRSSRRRGLIRFSDLIAHLCPAAAELYRSAAVSPVWCPGT